jgi:hypothetical protein
MRMKRWQGMLSSFARRFTAAGPAIHAFQMTGYRTKITKPETSSFVFLA